MVGVSSDRTGPGAEDDLRSDGRSTRWDAHRARRREQVVDAALVVLGRDGEDFGLDQVAHEAGVTKPVIYRHFGDRAALLDAMAERATDRLMERLMPALYRESAARTRIHDSVDAVIGFFDDSPGVDLLFRRRLPGQRGEVVDAGREFIASALTGLLGAYAEMLDVHEADLVRVWSQSVVGAVQATAEWWLRGRESGAAPDRDVVADHLTDLIWVQIEGMARRRGLTLGSESLHPTRAEPK